MKTVRSSMVRERPEVISYLNLRKTVGVLGILLPLIMIAGSFIFGACEEVQNSISAYYHTNMRNVFVGTISAIALFLFVYKGYNRKDGITGTLGGIFALCVAFFPTSVSEPFTNCIPGQIDTGIIHIVHFVSAGLFFLVLAWFSLFLFTKKQAPVTKRKLLRNKLYYGLGTGILVCLALIIMYYLFLEDRYIKLQKYDPVFWLETLAMWCFGTSWLIKGETILRDPESETHTNS